MAAFVAERAVPRQPQRLVGRRIRGSDRSGPREHDGPKERFSIETKGFIETTGPKIRDLEVPTELASELVLGNDGNGELGLFGSTERQN